MVRMTMAIAMVLALSGAAFAQEGERKGDKEKKKEGKEASMGLNDVDTNRDGRAQASELTAAIARLTGNREEGEKKKEGDKKEGGKKEEGKRK